jgi:uncharacterized protein YjbJ (UPF0337 family)
LPRPCIMSERGYKNNMKVSLSRLVIGSFMDGNWKQLKGKEKEERGKPTHDDLARDRRQAPAAGGKAAGTPQQRKG